MKIQGERLEVQNTAEKAGSVSITHNLRLTALLKLQFQTHAYT